MTDERGSIPEFDPTAAEYALGLLTDDELREARRRVATDSIFAAEVARWRGRLAQLFEEIEGVAPPNDLWGRIRSSLGERSASNDNSEDLHRTVKRWRSATGMMTALAAALGVFLLLQPGREPAPLPPPPPPVQSPAPPMAAVPPMVAILGDKSSTKVVASWDSAARQLVLAVAGDMPSKPGKSYQLWVIPGDGKPRSLGLMPRTEKAHVQLAEAVAQLLQPGSTIAISVEPDGGSPTGAPTGPVVASGALGQA